MLREQSSNGPKGRARGAVAAGLSRLHALRKGKNTGSSEFLNLVLLIGRHVDFLLSPHGTSKMRFEHHCEMASQRIRIFVFKLGAQISLKVSHHH